MEYKIIRGKEKHCQTVLNQWKHEYILNIIQMVVYDHDIFILLTRTKKGT